MAGLNSLISNTTTQATNLPSWYDTAQQNLASGASAAAAQVPGVGATPVAGVAEKMMSGASPFTQAQTSLGNIAAGAANPWLTDASGNITPNTGTAMGGLFKAQTDYLTNMMPEIGAAPTAGAIGSGGFGSKMNLAGVEKARANAINELFKNQMSSALQNQATGVSAGTGLSSSGSQEAQSGIGIGQFQQNAPIAGQTALANIINPMRTGTNVTNATQVSPLNQIAGIVSLLGGASGTEGLLKSLGISGGLPALVKNIGNLFPSGGGSDTVTPPSDGSDVGPPDTGGGEIPVPDINTGGLPIDTGAFDPTYGTSPGGPIDTSEEP
jgi:hypothetical protein